MGRESQLVLVVMLLLLLIFVEREIHERLADKEWLVVGEEGVCVRAEERERGFWIERNWQSML